jgi:hypothetical protein
MLEEIRAQNAATLEAIHTYTRVISDDIKRLDARITKLVEELESART